MRRISSSDEKDGSSSSRLRYSSAHRRPITSFFKAFRKRRPYNENLLLPCTIIDNPHVLREAVAEGGAHPTHPGSESIITTLAPALDEYARAYGEVAGRAWEREYRDNMYLGHGSVVEQLINGRRNGRKKNRLQKVS